MDTKNNKTIWIVAGLVVVALVIVYAFRSSPVITTNDTVVTPAVNEPVGTLDASYSSSPAMTISYADALVKYKDRRIQFNTVCQAFPNTVTYNEDMGVMIDNRSPSVRGIMIDKLYTIKPYGFIIVKLPNVTLNGKKTYGVDCDKQLNTATILVQE
jgi:hypothetical protein